MKVATKLAAASLLLVAAAGHATAGQEDSKPSNCASVKLVKNFTYVDDKTATIETGPSKKYKVTFTTVCRALKSAHAIRVEARPGTCLSSGDVVVLSEDGVIPERCFVDKVEALPAEPSATPAPEQH